MCVTGDDISFYYFTGMPSRDNWVARAFTCGIIDKFFFQAPPMPACRSMEEINLAAMLATKSFAGVTPEVNINTYVNKAVHSGFET